jgi:hypothetical protein
MVREALVGLGALGLDMARFAAVPTDLNRVLAAGGPPCLGHCGLHGRWRFGTRVLARCSPLARPSPAVWLPCGGTVGGPERG